MATPPLSDEKCLEAVETMRRTGSVTKAAGELGIARTTMEGRLRAAGRRGLYAAEPAGSVTSDTHIFTPVSLPDELLPIDQLLDRRRKQFLNKRRYEEATRLIPIKVNISGPVGILHFGDPHVDDDGTDIVQLERDVEIIKRTEGMLAANVGDTTNNWVGRLAALYAQQSTSAAEAWQLAEWFLTQLRWLYIIAGNHDLWSGTGDPIKWIAKQTGSLYKSSEIRIALKFPNGREVRVNARHDHAGHSQYNPAHGTMKALTFGVRDHIATCGHKHTSGYGLLKDPETGIAMHAIQVSSYKIFDRYAKEKGFRDQSLSPCCVTVIDPSLEPTHPDLVKVFWDAQEGADFLAFKRRKSRK